MRRIAILVSLVACLGSAAAAQNPFVGTWRLDPQKSQLAGQVLTFGPAQGAAMELSAEGQKYSFRVDGYNYRMASGDLAMWRQVDPSTWVTVYRKSTGEQLHTDTWQMAMDEQSMTVITAGIDPDGSPVTNTVLYTRTAGSNGLIGSWKSTGVKLQPLPVFQIQAYGLGGITITDAAQKSSLTANFDGKEAAPQGPNVSKALTIALFRLGPSGFREVKKMNGQVFYDSRFTVAADGKTMTEAGGFPGDAPQTSVWSKQ